jgi:ElaB/YqjD/DUF883 family membrane-anchored ribosome-binding protein
MSDENNIFEYYADGIEKINQTFINELREVTKRYVYFALFSGLGMGTTTGLLIGILI